MHHEHHADCCQPHESNDHGQHAAAIAQLGQACCAGACHHMHYRAAMDHLPAGQLLSAETLFVTGNSRTKKKKQRRLGRCSLSVADESTRVMQSNLPQYR